MASYAIVVRTLPPEQENSVGVQDPVSAAARTLDFIDQGFSQVAWDRDDGSRVVLQAADILAVWETVKPCARCRERRCCC